MPIFIVSAWSAGQQNLGSTSEARLFAKKNPKSAKPEALGIFLSTARSCCLGAYKEIVNSILNDGIREVQAGRIKRKC